MDASAAAPTTPPKSTVTNVIDDPTVTLQRFDLLDLQQYTQEKSYATTASRDFHLFYVGRDDVHAILKHVLSRVSVSLYLKGFVADGKVAGEGSTNWSDSGEGTFVVKGQPGGAGYKAQNNTQSIITDPDTISRFSSELVAEHMVAQKQATATGAAANRSLKTKGAKPATDAREARAHPGLVRHRSSHMGA
jgi:hypothetical protein